MEKELEKELNKEYEEFIRWRCKLVRIECESKMEEGINTTSMEFTKILMIESYKKGLSDAVKLFRYII